MCYNAPKSWVIGWYDELSDKIDLKPITSTTQWSGKLVGVTDYDNNNRQQEPVLVRVDSTQSLDLYVNFNHATGMTSQMKMAPDKVCVYEQGGAAATSKIIGQLSQGEVFTQHNFGGSGKALTITVNKIDLSANPGFANVNICLGVCGGPTNSPSPTRAPTRKPTISPTESSTPT